MWIFIYNLSITFLLPFILIYYFTSNEKIGYRNLWLQLRERMGWLDIPPFTVPWIWVHSASVGETLVAENLIPYLTRIFPGKKFLLSVYTPTAYNLAKQKKIGDFIVYVPFDWYFFVRKVLIKIRPEFLFLIETELWPNLISLTKLYGTKVVLVNGRISTRSYRIYRVGKFFWRKIFNQIDLFCMRERIDFSRILSLGAPVDRVKLTGNLKYDLWVNPKIDDKELSTLLKLPSDNIRILTIGSLREGEEEIVLPAIKILLTKFTGLKVIIAPRHLTRVPIIEMKLKQQNITYIKRSNLSLSQVDINNLNCMLLDTYGELTDAYKIADIVFVGGSLVSLGGQNIIEPAVLGKPILFGPYMSNFQEPADRLNAAGASFIVSTGEELIFRVECLLQNPELGKQMGLKARDVVLNLSGTTERIVSLIKQMLLNVNSNK